jgi:hypothetical protein
MGSGIKCKVLISSHQRFASSFHQRGGLHGEQKGWIRFSSFILNGQWLIGQLLQLKRHIPQRSAAGVL